MSGTSMDGVDVALIKTDGHRIVEHGGVAEFPFPQETVLAIKSVLGKSDKNDADVKSVAREITLLHALAVEKFLTQENLKPSDIDVIGFHGQTIFHAPQDGITTQIGDGDLLAAQTGIDVVYDFRVDDVLHGGQGAPLVPVYHRALCADLPKPVCLINIGGIANVTYLDNDDDKMMGFDTGPGNGMMNDIVQKFFDKDYDDKGEIAKSGTVDMAVVDEFLKHPYFSQIPPKSLDKNSFDLGCIKHLLPQDALATLLEIVVVSMRQSFSLLPQYPETILLCGGGRKNDFLMERIKQSVNCAVKDVDSMGWRGDAIEAEAFAFMAVRHLLGLPNSFPGTTGTRQPVVGGVFTAHKKVAA